MEEVRYDDIVECPHCWNVRDYTWEELFERNGIDWQEAFAFIWACPVCDKPSYISNENGGGGIEVGAISYRDWHNAGYKEMYEKQGASV